MKILLKGIFVLILNFSISLAQIKMPLNDTLKIMCGDRKTYYKFSFNSDDSLSSYSEYFIENNKPRSIISYSKTFLVEDSLIRRINKNINRIKNK